MTHHSALSRPKALALGTLAAVVLTGCSEGGVAEFEDAAEATQDGAPDEAIESSGQVTDAAEETAAAPVEAEPGLVYEDISHAPAVLETLRPEDGAVVTPAGTLTVDEVEVVETVPAGEIGLSEEEEGQEEQDEQVEQAQATAAEGEEFRILTMSFTPDEATEGIGDEVLDVDAALALSIGGVQSHLHDLDGQQDFRILFSVPQDGSGSLTISSEGHDQSIDVLTGERAEDEVSAGYYREVTNQDLNHTFPVESDRVVLQHERREGDEGQASVDYDLRVNSVGLAGWSEQEGWAAPGEAWLVIDWAYQVAADNDVYADGSTRDLDITLVADLGDQVVEGNVKNQDSRRTNRAGIVTVLAVPSDTVDVTLSLSGTAEFEIKSSAYDVADEAQSRLEFATDQLEVAFPDTRYGSVADEVQEAEDNEGDADEGDVDEGRQQDDDQVEETGEPSPQDDA